MTLIHGHSIGGERNQGAPDIRGSLNIAGFADNTYDQASDSAMKLYDSKARAAALATAAQRARMLAPYVVLYRPTTTVIYASALARADRVAALRCAVVCHQRHALVCPTVSVVPRRDAYGEIRGFRRYIQ
jgi:hypothetical protein